MIDKNQIQNYIPHRAPFVMVDNVLSCSSEKIETNFFISQDNVFVDNNQFQEFGMLENIAQSAAAGISLLNKNLKETPSEGFLGAITKLNLFAYCSANETITTTIYPLQQLGNLYLIKGEVFYNNNKLLECELKLAGI